MNFKIIKPPYNLQPLITNGLTNNVFLINNQYFLKLSKPINQPFLNFTNELNVITLIQWAKFTLPIIEYKLINNQLQILMPYYHDLLTLNAQPIDQDLLITLSLLIKKLHHITFNNTIAIMTWNALEQLHLYCNLITLDINFLDLKTKIINWINNYQPAKLVLCHNDLTLNNFVKKNNTWYLIDWDFACWNDPLFDIASFASESLNNDEEIKLWFKCFNLTQTQINTVKNWMVYQNLIWYYWAYYLYDQTKIAVYKQIGDHKLKILLAQQYYNP